MKTYLLILSCCLLWGCSSMTETGQCYMDSYKPAVRYPATVGLYVGSPVGIAAVIVCLPVTWPLAYDDRSGLLVLAPWIYTAYPFAAVAGYIPAKITGETCP